MNAGISGIQPNPHTLRGAETNFYAEASEQTFNVIICCGQKVAIIAKPVQYRWDYGDGSSLGPTTTMGGPLPQDRWGEKTATSHAYAQTGDFNVILTTYFQGTYSVNRGPALPIPNQGQFSTAPQTVSVWRSVTRNYADDCITNPRGQGCPGADCDKGPLAVAVLTFATVGRAPTRAVLSVTFPPMGPEQVTLSTPGIVAHA